VKRRVALAIIVAGLVIGHAVPASADLDDDLAQVEAQIEALRSQVGGVRSDRTDLANEILDTGDRLDALAAELADARRRLDETDAEIAATQARIDDLTGRIGDREQHVADLGVHVDAMRGEAAARAVELYMQGDSPETVILLGAGDASRLSVGIAYASQLQEVANGVIGDLESLSAQARREQGRLEQEREELESEANVLAFQHDERAAAAEAVEQRAAAVQAEMEQLQQQLAQMEAEIAEIEGEIASLEREQNEIEALIVQQSNSGGSRPGVLYRPVPGGVSSGYGYRIHPIYGVSRLHTGWDMNAACGDPIHAAESGTVIYAGWRGGYGNAVIIDHGGGMSTLYGHQSRLGVSYGQSVHIGDTIGWIGSTGVSTACHLHFEVRINGAPVDPTPYM
jgi:murein DD-endopeptidase MepM/ murein hydrolase activator NlpD